MLGMTWGDISPWIFYDMGLPLLLVAAAAYLLGCSNGAVIVSKYILRDDVRTHGSGNAGLTNFYRTFGGPLTLVVILCDVLKAVAAVWAGILMARYWDGGFWSQEAIVLVFAKYWAGLFCLLGHMFPCMFHFKGGKGILSGGTIAIMIDWRIALVVWGGIPDPCHSHPIRLPGIGVGRSQLSGGHLVRLSGLDHHPAGPALGRPGGLHAPGQHPPSADRDREQVFSAQEAMTP